MERGECPKQGARTDISEIREIAKSGGSMRDIIDIARNLQDIRIAEKILQYNEKKRDWIPTVYWFWGPTGTGKTRTARDMFPDAWWSGKDLKWWQGYDAHETVILDDFRGDFCTFHELLRILDRYPYTIECKGGSRQLLARNIIITCPKPPNMVYLNCGEQLEQLLRRITEIRHFEPCITFDESSEVEGNTNSSTIDTLF